MQRHILVTLWIFVFLPSHKLYPHNVPEEESCVKQSVICAVCLDHFLIAVHLSGRSKKCPEVPSLTLLITRYDNWEIITI